MPDKKCINPVINFRIFPGILFMAYIIISGHLIFHDLNQPQIKRDNAEHFLVISDSENGNSISPSYTGINLVAVAKTHGAGQNTLLIILILISATLSFTVYFLLKSRQNKYTKEITRKESEKQALIRHFDYLRFHANDPIFLIAPDGSIINANQRAFQYYGYTQEEILEMSVNDIRAPEARKDINNQISMVKRSKGHVFETLHRRKDGTIFPVEVSSRFFEVEGQHFIHSIVRDISERKKAEKEIQKLDDHNKMILESAGEGIMGINTSGRIIFINKAGAEMIGYTPSELQGVKSHETIHYRHPDHSNYSESECPIFRSLKRGIKLNVTEGCFSDREGEMVPVEYTTNPLIEEGELKGCVVIFRDISGKKMAEEQLILAKEIAEESSKLKSAILMNMSHELRTPLNGILGFAQLLARKMKDAPEKQMVDQIMISGDRLLRTLTNILELAQLESDQSRLNIEQLSLKNIISDLTARYNPLAAGKNLFLKNNIKEDYKIRADNEMLHQSLRHILDNAIKFTESGGISISADQVERNGMLFVRIKISDTGIGIPKEEVKNIFMEFRQLSQGYKRDYEGSGIGLSLVNKMIVLMNGDISLNSEPGIGSEFTVSMPAGKITGNSDEKSKGAKIIEGKNIKRISGTKVPEIMIVEDNDTNARLIAAYLENAAKLEIVTDGVTAILTAKKKLFDIVLMDINLGPGIDGLETTAKLRRIPGYEKTPVIAVTGYTMAADKEKMLTHGCDYFLPKPFTQEELRLMIDKII